MKRRLFTLAAAASLLLCFATAALWVRSRYVIDYVTWRFARDRSFGAVLNPNCLYVGRRHEISPPKVTLEHESGPVVGSMAPLPPEGRVFAFAGFEYHWHPQVAQVRIPLAAPVIIGLIGAGYFRWRGRSERRLGACHTCAYDLRATPQRCPECGTAAAEPFEAPRAPRGVKER